MTIGHWYIPMTRGTERVIVAAPCFAFNGNLEAIEYAKAMLPHHDCDMTGLTWRAMPEHYTHPAATPYTGPLAVDRVQVTA